MLLLTAWLALGSVASAQETWPQNSFYKTFPLFNPYPDEKAARYVIERLGPVGIGIDLVQPAFTMVISNVEPESPAASTTLKKGQIIESINGQVLKDIDPRVQLGNMITQAEATDGVMTFMVKDSPTAPASEVVVRIPVLGTYSDTWPVNCSKSERIIRNFADFLARINKGGYGAATFLLSTGEEKDLEVVRSWFHNMKPGDIGGIPWDIGYNGPAVCEYYLRTGDATVLPAIQHAVDYLHRTIYNGAWAGRGGAPFRYMAGGHLNAAGVHCVTFLLLAKECGADVPEETLQSTLRHFFRYAGRGNVSYGDGLPEGGFVDNGKTGGLAFAMAAAVSLTPEGEQSVYAKARDISATKSLYSTSWLYHGHTGGGIGEIWRGAAMGLVKDKRPTQYRSFMDERRWMYDLSRCHDGAFGITGSHWNAGGGYNVTGHKGGRAWGNCFAWVYTIPRKQLRIFGAPPTQYSKPYALPARPWGTAADDAFYSLEPGEYQSGRSLDISGETVPTDASWPLSRRIGGPDASDDTLRMYASHIDQAIRDGVARSLVIHNRDHLIVEFLRHKDPRTRYTGAHAISGQFKGQALPVERLTDEMVAELLRMINDPEESWWCVHDAMLALRGARKELIEPHADRLLYWLNHEDWWLRKAAMVALTSLAADERYCDRILPLIGDMIATNQRAVAMQPVDDIMDQVQQADPKVQTVAAKTLADAYRKFPTQFKSPGGQNMNDGVTMLLEGIASQLVRTPGGYDELYRISMQRYPNATLPHKQFYLAADASKFSPELREAFKPLLREELIPEYLYVNRRKLESELGTRQPGPAVEGLVALYQRLGINDYDWRLWGPARDKIQWHYHTFDAKEVRLPEPGPRYRQISWPDGMDNWYTPDFNPSKAGWKTGLAPFANNNGKLAALGGCKGNFCGCGDPPNTFWDKEVLLMRSNIELSAMQDTHAYRLLVGGRSHVNAGDGSDVWFNGQLVGKKRPTLDAVGKRQGGQPWGFTIADEFRKEFDSGKVLLAITGFLRQIDSQNARRNYQAFWFEQMKLPTITTEQVRKSATMAGLLSAEWQSLQDPDNPELDPESGRFRFDGKYTANPGLLGSWQLIDQYDTIDAFTPPAKPKQVKAWLTAITFKDDGLTDARWRLWTGDTLLDLEGGQALRMVLKTLDGTDYLFIEAGGFKAELGPTWQSRWLAFKRAK